MAAQLPTPVEASAATQGQGSGRYRPSQAPINVMMGVTTSRLKSARHQTRISTHRLRERRWRVNDWCYSKGPNVPSRADEEACPLPHQHRIGPHRRRKTISAVYCDSEAGLPPAMAGCVNNWVDEGLVKYCFRNREQTRMPNLSLRHQSLIAPAGVFPLRSAMRLNPTVGRFHSKLSG
jgi:hypothetical protein